MSIIRKNQSKHGIIIDDCLQTFQLKKLILLSLSLFLISSCIPLQIAPSFEKKGYKVKQANRFKRKLPKENAFIFLDKKDADEFLNFVIRKFDIPDSHQFVDKDVPITINFENYLMSFYEINKNTTTLNFFPMIVDGIIDTDMSDEYTWSHESWYIIIVIKDENNNNTLDKTHPKREEVINFLKQLKQKYISKSI